MTDTSPTASLADITTEIARERAARERVYPGRVAKGLMTQREADWQLQICTAWAEDVARYQASIMHYRTDPATRRGPPPAADHGLTWHDRREALTRELELRDRVYPQSVAKGNFTADEAARRTARLAALAWLYDDGFDWHARNGLRILLGHDCTTAAEHDAQLEWWTHYEATMQRRGQFPPAQEALAL